MRHKRLAFGLLSLLAALVSGCATLTPLVQTTPEVQAIRTQSIPPQPTSSAPFSAPWYLQGVSVEVFAGTGNPGHKDGPRQEAEFYEPLAVAADAAGNVFVFDWFNYSIRRITPDGTVSTLAGAGEAGFVDGQGRQAKFRGLAVSMVVDPKGDLIVPDADNNRIRYVTPAGIVSTLAGTGVPGYQDGKADQAQFNNPNAVAMDAAGNLYVADTLNHRIRLITPQGEVRTIAGTGESGYKDGPAMEAQFDLPNSLAVTTDGGIVVAEGAPYKYRGSRRVRFISPDGRVSTLAGDGEPGFKDGPAAATRFVFPVNPLIDTAGNVILLDGGDLRVRLISPAGVVYTLAGSGDFGLDTGSGPSTQLIDPVGLALSPQGTLYLTEPAMNRILRIRYGSPPALTPLPTATPPPEEPTIKIGYALLYKGVGYVWLLNAAKMAIDEANVAGGVTVGGVRHRLQLVIAPWCCGEEGAISGAKQLIDQGVVLVLGYIRSEGAIAASPVYDAAGLTHIILIAQDPAITQAGRRTAFRVAPNLAFGAPIGARLAFENLGIRSSALLVEPFRPGTSYFQQISADEWEKAFEALGGKAFRHELTLDNLEETLAAVRAEGAEAILIFRPEAWADSIMLIEQIRKAGVTLPIISIFGDIPRLNAAIEGLYDLVPGRPLAVMPGYAGFVEKYRAAGFPLIQEPFRLAEFGYDAANLAIAAIRLAAQGGDVSRESVTAAMQTFRVQPFAGVSGPIQFDEYGDLLDQPYYFRRVVNAQWVDITP